MTITYQLMNQHDRETVNLFEYRKDILEAIKGFPMVELVDMSVNYYTITVNTNNNETKNGIVKALGHKIARTRLKKYVEHKKKANVLFIELKPKKGEAFMSNEKKHIANETVYVIYTYWNDSIIWKDRIASNDIDIRLFSNMEEIKKYLYETIKAYMIPSSIYDCKNYKVNQLRISTTIWKDIDDIEEFNTILRRFIDETIKISLKYEDDGYFCVYLQKNSFYDPTDRAQYAPVLFIHGMQRVIK